jgi:hypothetical protein
MSLRTGLLALATVFVVHTGTVTLAAYPGPGGQLEGGYAEGIEAACPNVRCSDIDSCEFRINRHCCVDGSGSSCTTADCGQFETCPSE